MTCKNCGTHMPDGVKFCSNCGDAISLEPAGVDVPAAFDPDATVIADHVAPAAPVAPVYQAPVQPVTPTYQAPVVPAAPQKNGINVKLIAIIGAVVAVIVAIVLIIVFAGGKNKDEDGKDSGSSVAAVVQEYAEDCFADYVDGDVELSNYKSEYKISEGDAYYQVFTAKAQKDTEKGYLLGVVFVYKNSVEEFEYDFCIEEAKSEFDEYVSEFVEECKKNEEELRDELANFSDDYEDEYYYNY